MQGGSVDRASGGDRSWWFTVNDVYLKVDGIRSPFGKVCNPVQTTNTQQQRETGSILVTRDHSTEHTHLNPLLH